MQFDKEIVDGTVIVRVREKKLTSHEAPEMKTALLALMESDGEEFVINLKEVDYMDSTGLGSFLFGIRQADRYDKEIIFCELKERIRTLIRIAQLEQIVEVYDTEKEAVEAFQVDEEE